MLPLRSAVGVTVRMIPNFLNSTANWFCVATRSGISPPAVNSAFSPLAQSSRGCESTRWTPESNRAVREKSVDAERDAARECTGCVDESPGSGRTIWYTAPEP